MERGRLIWILVLAAVVSAAGCLAPTEDTGNASESPKAADTSAPGSITSPPVTAAEAPTKVTARLLWTFQADQDMYGVGFSSGAGTVVAASWDWNVYALNRTGGLLWKFRTRGGARDVAVSKSGRYVVTGSFLAPTGYLYLLNRTGDLLWEKEFESEVHGVDINEELGRIGAALGDGRVLILDLEGNPITTVATQESGWGAWDVAFDRAGNFAVGADDHTLYHVKKDGRVSWKRDLGKKAYIYGVAMSRDGRYVAAAIQDRGVFLFDGTGRALWRFTTGFSNYGAAVSSEGPYVAAGSWDGNLYLLDSSGREVWRYPVGDNVNRVALSPEGDYLAAASSDGNLYLFALDIE